MTGTIKEIEEVIVDLEDFVRKVSQTKDVEKKRKVLNMFAIDAGVLGCKFSRIKTEVLGYLNETN